MFSPGSAIWTWLREAGKIEGCGGRCEAGTVDRRLQEAIDADTVAAWSKA